MAFLLMRRETSDVSTATTRFEVRRYGHDTALKADTALVNYSSQDPGPFDLDPAIKAGQYCDGTTLVEVYHLALGSNQSRLQRITSAPACPLTPPPTVPANSLLLLRTFLGVNVGDIQRDEYYYNYATRAVVHFGPTPVSAVGTAFSRATTTLIDAYCLAAGAAPYTERRVFHDGSGGLTLQEVNDAVACRIGVGPLTLTVASQGNETGAGGDGFAVLQAGGAGGNPLTYSLDGFQENTPSTAPRFDRLRAGTYRATAREEIGGGRQVSVNFTILAPRGLRYTSLFVDRDNVPHLAEFHLRGYVGPSTALRGAADGLALSWPGGGTDHFFTKLLRGSEAEITVLVLEAGQELAALAAVDERAVRVDVRRNTRVAGGGSLLWRGHLLPDLFDAPLLAPPYPLTLRATDGLGTLKDLPLGDAAGNALPAGVFSQRELLQRCLSLLDCDLPLASSVNLRPDPNTGYGDTPSGGAPAGAFTAASSDALGVAGHLAGGFADEKGKAFSAGKTLEAILRAYDAQLLQWEGAWHLRRLQELATGALPTRWHGPNFAALPAPASPGPLLQTVTPPTPAAATPLMYRDSQQAVSLVAAAGEVVLSTAPGKMLNLFPEGQDWPALAFTPGGRLQRWTGLLPHARRVRKAGAGVLELQTTTLTGAVLQSPELAGVNGFEFTIRATLRGVPAAPQGGPLPLTHTYNFAVEAVGGRPIELFGNRTGAVRPGPNYGVFMFDAVDTVQEFTFSVRTQAPAIVGEVITARLVLQQPHAGTVEIERLRVTYGFDAFTGGGGDERLAYVSEYRHTPRVGGRNTGKDESELLVFDTPLGWMNYTAVLLPKNELIVNWQEAPGVAPLELGDLLGRDRLLWQQRPCRVLRAPLRGVFSPLNLLTDPNQYAPAVYVPTGLRWLVSEAVWQVTAVENLQLRAPLPHGTPANVILYENGSPMLSEAGNYLLYETA